MASSAGAVRTRGQPTAALWDLPHGPFRPGLHCPVGPGRGARRCAGTDPAAADRATSTCANAGRRAGPGCTARAARQALTDAEVVLHVSDAAHALGDVFRPPLNLPAVHRAGQGDLTVRDSHLDLGGVNPRIVGQAIADVLADTLIRTDIAFRSAPAMVLGALVALPGILLTPARRLIGAEPRRDLVRATIPEATLAAIARHPTVLVTVALAPVAAILALAAVAAAPVPRTALTIAAVIVAPVASAAVVTPVVVAGGAARAGAVIRARPASAPPLVLPAPALCIIVAEPGPDLVRSPVTEIALPAPIPLAAVAA